MATGLYITIGLNSVDSNVYGSVPDLRACENDAIDMAEIATKGGLTGTTLLTKSATSSAVLKALFEAAAMLKAGDLLILAYSGHGAQVGDVNGEEADGLDETWCLYDRMLVDDELYAMWAQFKPGVRIFVLSDSCHSGTVLKNLALKTMSADGFFVPIDAMSVAAMSHSLKQVAKDAGQSIETGDLLQSSGRVKSIDFDKTWRVYQASRGMYDSLQFVAGSSEKSVIGASVILISGCQDNQLSQDGEKNGMFTYALKKVWASGQYGKNYQSFQKDIQAQLPMSQSPNYMTVGAVNLAFEAQKPFTL